MSRKDTVFTHDLYQFPEIIAPSLTTAKGVHTLSLTKYAEMIPPSDSELLSKILQAVGARAQPSLCINIGQEKQPFYYFRQQYQPKYVICFGITPQDLGFQFQIAPYQLIRVSAIQFLFADSLANIANDKQKKAILWNTLKLMYQV